MHSIYLILLLMAIVSNSVIIFVLLKRSDRGSAIISFIIFLLGINMWAFPVFLYNAFSVENQAYEVLSRLSALGYIIVPAAFCIFSLTFLQEHHRLLRRFRFWLFFLSIPVLFLFLSWSTNLIEIHEFGARFSARWGYAPQPGTLFLSFLAWFVVMMIASISVLFRTYQLTTDPNRKKQALFVIIAVMIPLVIGTMTDGILPVMDIIVFPLAIPLTSAMGILILYAMQRFGLFEIEMFSVLSSIEEGIIAVDRSGKIIQANRFSENILGLTHNHTVNQKISLVGFTDHKGKKINMYSHLIRSVIRHPRKITSASFMVLDKNKRSFPVALTISPLFSQKRVVGATILFRDITKELRREQYREDFIGFVSHELKTPITSIKAYVQLLQRNVPATNGERYRAIVTRIDNELNKLARLISVFLEFSRIESGKLRLTKEPTSLTRLVGEMVETFRINNRQREFVFKTRGEYTVSIDIDRIGQVLVNLINNAIKYSQSNKKIIISILAEHGLVVVTIKDFGSGIPSSYHKKIFERGFQLHQHGKGRGLGLGLYISAIIVRQHGGKIWVESREGQGSTFSFSLPRD